MGQSVSISKVVKDSSKAGKSIHDLTDVTSNKIKEKFELDIAKGLLESGLSHHMLVYEGSFSQIEYETESSIDELGIIVTSELNKISLAAQSNKVFGEEFYVTPDLIQSYIDFVSAFYQYSKIASTSEKASYSSEYSRIVESLFCFICCSSVAIQDEALFGEGTVIITTYKVKIIYSEDDLKTFDLQNIQEMNRATADILSSSKKTEDTNYKHGDFSQKEYKIRQSNRNTAFKDFSPY
ncbi:hypothetical protein PPL_03334 [Heterostelium album PN500]|uniref:Uncharacterized protein n=1 Tax=Heterostelium pallidum (strain ATCC 26659 / Pp 5 / PN500) TaxID=670386 RepID=D3B4K9_HETP5|nr:hypothetical protein PPL_03334 [Heterostelium album PN500]EFA84257.1 hypothetical protein PPL_03334 [Heterostelium album PN500]|eukprot:XP_020436373.1 hypothetical protein PPL_03334 [Heterostelium album PN500]